MMVNEVRQILDIYLTEKLINKQYNIFIFVAVNMRKTLALV